MEVDMSNTIEIAGISLTKPVVDDKYKSLIPPVEDYEPQGEEISALALGYKHNRPVMLMGHTGTGKNAAIRWFANKIGAPLFVVSLAEGTTSDNLIGLPVPVNGDKGLSVEWRDGVLPNALRAGGILVLDEINAADERTLMRLHDFLANDYDLNIYENPSGSERVSPTTGFMLVATANPADSGQYAGAKILNEATLDRFIVSEVQYLGLAQPEKEAVVIARASGIKHSRAMRIVEVMNTIRKACGIAPEPVKEGQPAYNLAMFVTASTRRAIDIAILSNDVPMMSAVEIAFTNKVNAEDRPVVHKLFLDSFAGEDAPKTEEVANA
jgi:MoxR-like ATPase